MPLSQLCTPEARVVSEWYARRRTRLLVCHRIPPLIQVAELCHARPVGGFGGKVKCQAEAGEVFCESFRRSGCCC